MAKIVTVDMDKIYARGGRVFVVSDLHGNFEAFSHWIETVHFNNKDFCIVNGDVIDRGEWGFGILNWIAENPKNFLFLIGNHEELMLSALDEMQMNKSVYSGDKQQLWFLNGGEHTYEDMLRYPQKTQEFVLNFLRNSAYVARLTTATNQRDAFVCHAGLTAKWLNEVYNDHLSKDKHGMSNITWARDEWWHRPSDFYHLLVTGHTSTHNFGGKYGEPLFDGLNQRIVIDCNTIKSNKVGYVRFKPNSLEYGSY